MKQPNVKLTNVRWLAIAILPFLMMGCFNSDDPKDPIEEVINDAPTAVNGTFVTQTDTAVMGQLVGSDLEGDALSYSLGDAPSLGQVTVNSDGSFTYQPSLEVTGTDSFTFVVSDAQNRTDTAVATITIETLVVSFANVSRAAFAADATAMPQRLNGRDFTQDVLNQEDYQDLVDGN